MIKFWRKTNKIPKRVLKPLVKRSKALSQKVTGDHSVFSHQSTWRALPVTSCFLKGWPQCCESGRRKKQTLSMSPKSCCKISCFSSTDGFGKSLRGSFFRFNGKKFCFCTAVFGASGRPLRGLRLGPEIAFRSCNPAHREAETWEVSAAGEVIFSTNDRTYPISCSNGCFFAFNCCSKGLSGWFSRENPSAMSKYSSEALCWTASCTASSKRERPASNRKRAIRCTCLQVSLPNA